MLGLWQIGVVTRSTAPASGMTGVDATGQASTRFGSPVGSVSPAGPQQWTASGADGSVNAVPAPHHEQLVGLTDPEVQAESAALLEALAAERANDP